MFRRRSNLVGWAASAACLAIPVVLFAQAQPKFPTPLPTPKTGGPKAEAAKAEPAERDAKPAAAASGERDPFEPLVQKGEGESGIQCINLKLVGIIWDARDQRQVRALVETPDGLGYYLRNNEEQFGCKVTGIERDRVKFAVREQEPGRPPRVRTVELKLRGE